MGRRRVCGPFAGLSGGCRNADVAITACAILVGAAALGFGFGRAGTIEPAPTPAAHPVVPSAPPAAAEPTARAAVGFGGIFVRHAAADGYVAMWREDLARTPGRLLDAYLSRPDRWRERIVPILAAHDVPPEFLYLALLESGMDPAAESPARAVGLWQFTAPTARHYGLRVEDGLDQRRDWRLATAAAGRYLRDLYDLFGTWELAAAAYNAGPGRVSRALRETDAGSYWDLLEAGRLPAETRAYVPKFLALVELASDRAAERRSHDALVGAAAFRAAVAADD